MSAPRRPRLPVDVQAESQANVLRLEIPPELVEAIAARAAELLSDRLDARAEPYLDVAAAADYLACPRSRLYSLVSAGRVPVHRDGSRLLFRANELDRWLEQGGGRRP